MFKRSIILSLVLCSVCVADIAYRGKITADELKAKVATINTLTGDAIGKNVQAWDDNLDDIAALIPINGIIMVGDGTDWTTETGVSVDANWVPMIEGTESDAERVTWKGDVNLDHVFDVRDYGVTGDGVTDDEVSIEAAITAAQAVDGTVYFPSSLTAYYFTTSISVPNDVTLKFEPGAWLKGDGTAIIDIDGGLVAGRTTIFNYDSMTVTGSPKIDAVFPEWFGVTTSESTPTASIETNNTSAMAPIISFTNNKRLVVEFGCGQYFFNGTIVENITGGGNKIHIRGQGPHETHFVFTAQAVGDIFIDIDKASAAIFTDFRSYESALNQQGICFSFGEDTTDDEVQHVTMTNVEIAYYDIAIQHGGGLYANYTNVYTWNNDIGVTFPYDNASVITNWYNCTHQSNYEYNIYSTEGGTNNFFGGTIETASGRSTIAGLWAQKGFFNFHNVHFEHNAGKNCMLGYGDGTQTLYVSFNDMASAGGGAFDVNDVNQLTITGNWTDSWADFHYDGTVESLRDYRTIHTDTSGNLEAGVSVLTVKNGGTIGQAAGPLQTFDDTNNLWHLKGADVGIGVTPETDWRTSPDFTAIQIGGTASLSAQTTPAAGDSYFIGQNFRHTNTGIDKYIVADEASLIQFTSGEIRFYNTDAGAADGTITWVRSGDIKKDGTWQLGSDASNVTVSSNGVVSFTSTTIAADDVTPDVSTGTIYVTSANTGATAITDLDNPVVGLIVRIIGGSDSNSSTIGDSGNFNLSASWTAALDDVLILYVQADNDYIEIGRVDN